MMIKKLKNLFALLWTNKPERVLRQLTSCKTVEDLRKTNIPVVTQVRNPNLHRPGKFLTLTNYLTQTFPKLSKERLWMVDLTFSAMPSLVPEHERFATVFFVYEHRIYDSGLVACVFDGDKTPSLLVRGEVVYEPEVLFVRDNNGPNLAGEVEEPGGATIHQFQPSA